jgi:hypothetical protein
MRTLLVSVSLLTLAACSGGGPQTVSSTAAPGAANATPADQHSFVSPTGAKTYTGVGGSQVFEYSTDDRDTSSAPGAQYVGQQAAIYAGNASTVRNSGISIAYDPRDAIFTLTVADPKSGATTATRFQDPASRTDFNDKPGVAGLEPQWGTPKLQNPNIRYLQAGDGDPRSPYRSSGSGLIDPGDNDTPPDATPGSSYQATSFFYEVPGSKNRAGTTTKYVSFAGYVRNTFEAAVLNSGDITATQNNWHLERGAFAYGELTNTAALPKTGTGTFDGGMLATMVMNPTLDSEYGSPLSTYFQWIEGTSHVEVDFAASTVKLGFNGTVSGGQFDRFTDTQQTTVPAGASFTATGQARIDVAGSGGFVGAINNASFGATTNGAPTAVSIAGSSVDGAFYGPKADEVGGGFRIVGGTPDERIDIVGAFTGAPK